MTRILSDDAWDGQNSRSDPREALSSKWDEQDRADDYALPLVDFHKRGKVATREAFEGPSKLDYPCACGAKPGEPCTYGPASPFAGEVLDPPHTGRGRQDVALG